MTVNTEGISPECKQPCGLCLVQRIYRQLETWPFRHTHALPSPLTVSLDPKDRSLQLIRAFAYSRLLINGDEYEH